MKTEKEDVSTGGNGEQREVTRPTAVILGASRDFGRSLAIGLDGLFDCLVLLGRDAAGLQETAGLLFASQAVTIPMDLADTAAIAASLAKIDALGGRIDLLALVAGGDYIGPARDMEEAEFALSLDRYVRGTMLFCRGALPMLDSAPRPRIFNFSIQWAVAQAGLESGSAPFVASKAAVAAFLGSLASEEWRGRLTITTLALGELADGPPEDMPEGGHRGIDHGDLVRLVRLLVEVSTLRIENALVMPSDPGAGRRKPHYDGPLRDV